MTQPIRFYFDFASPYAYFAMDAIEAIGAEFNRPVEWRPILMWAVLKAHGIAAPMDIPAKRVYFVQDMARSAAFYGLPYRHPARLPMSSHLAARVYHVLAARDEQAAHRFGRAVMRAFFAEEADIGLEDVVLLLAKDAGMEEHEARAAMTGSDGRAMLAAEVEHAVADRVCGSPFFIVDDETFFGADRLPQIRWRLSQTQAQSDQRG